MSSMNYIYKGSRKAKILSDLKGSASTTGKPQNLKGTTQEVDEYNFTVSGRGNPKGSTTKKYFLESSKENTMGVPPFGKQRLGGNPFQEIKREDFEYLAEEPIRIKQLQIARDGKNKISKKNYVWLISIGVAVLSYKFAKSNKEFYAFVGLLSPALIMMSKSKYEKIMRDKKAKIERERHNSLAQA